MVAIVRAMQRRCCWPPERPYADCLSLSLTSSHRAAPLQRLLDEVVHVVDLHAGDPRAVGDVVVDRLRERVGLLEHHADVRADGDGVDGLRVDVLAVVEHLTLDAGAGDEVVHPVEAAQHGGLAAAGGTDHRGDLVATVGQVDVVHGVEVAVEDVEVARLHDRVDRRGRRVAAQRRCWTSPSDAICGERVGGGGRSHGRESLSPGSLELVADEDGQGVEPQDHHEQDDDRGRGRLPGAPPGTARSGSRSAWAAP